MQKQNYVRFVLMSVLSIIMIVSGFIVWFILPRGGEGFRGGIEALVTQTEFLSLE